MNFLNPAILWGLGAVSIPVIIHLLNRRKFRVVRWAAMEHLLAANRQNRRRVRMEHLLLLLLRCLAIALVVLAFSRPETSQGGLMALPGVRDPIERIVLIDDSGSMGHQSGQTSAFDRARRVTRRLIEELRAERPGDLLTVHLGSRPHAPELLLAAPTNPRTDELLRRLEQSTPTHGRFDVVSALMATLARCTDLSAALPADRPAGELAGDRAALEAFAAEGALAKVLSGPARKVIYVVSDLRRGDWLGEDGLRLRWLAALLGRAPEGVRCLLVDVGERAERNLGVSAFRPTDKLAMEGVPVELVVRIANRGEAPVHDLPLVLEAGDVRVPLPPVGLIQPGQEAEVRHHYTFLQPGVQALSVSVPADPLALDDARHLAVEVQQRLRVLLVDGEPGAGPLEGETDLLRLALAPSGDLVTGVEPVVTTLEELGGQDLAQFHSIVLCNVEAWPAERLDDLERFVERGGGLALFLGDRVAPDTWERALYRDGKGLLPCRLGERRWADDPEEAPRVAPPPAELHDHPLVQVFLGDRNPFLRRVRARGRYTLPRDRERDAGTRVVLALDDPARTPLVVEEPYGRGRVVLFNATADLAWSTWPRDPSFPVTAQELVRLLAPPSTAGRNQTVGEPIERPLNAALYGPTATLLAPGPKAQPLELHAEPRAGSSSLWLRFAGVERAGLYRIALRPRQEGLRDADAVAVNVDPTEGDLARADPLQLQATLGAERAQVARPGPDGGILGVSDGARAELWRTCLLVLVLIMGLEQVLACRAAHHRRDLPEEGPAPAAPAPTATSPSEVRP